MLRRTHSSDAPARGRAPRTWRALAPALGLAALLLAPAARATPAWTLGLDGPDWDAPVLTLTNTSTAGELLTGLSVLVGNTAFNFDMVVGSHPSEATTGATLASPDRAPNAARSDELAWAFTDFGPGEVFVFQVELDRDAARFGNTVDARDILFSNDRGPFANPNSLVTTAFSDGSTIAFTLPDGAGSSFTYTSAPAVPEPSLALLLATALLALATTKGPGSSDNFRPSRQVGGR